MMLLLEWNLSLLMLWQNGDNVLVQLTLHKQRQGQLETCMELMEQRMHATVLIHKVLTRERSTSGLEEMSQPRDQ